MNNDNKFKMPREDDLDHDLLHTPDVTEEIGADVQAILSAGLTDPSEVIAADVETYLPEDPSDPTDEIAAEVQAFLSEDPTDEIAADVQAFLSEDASDPADEIAAQVQSFFFNAPPDLTDEAADVQANAEDAVSFATADDSTSMPTVLIHIPEEDANVDSVTANSDGEVASLPQLDDVTDPVEDFDILASVADTAAETDSFQADAADMDATRIIDAGEGPSHSLLDDPIVGTEIEADEHAIHAAGLLHPAEVEIDRIIADAKAMDENPSEAQPVSSDSEIPQNEGPVTASESFPTGNNASDMVIQDYVDPSLPQEEPPKEPEEAPQRKRRPKMKKGYGLFGLPHVAATAIWLAITVLIGVSLGRMIWVCAAEVLAFGKPDKEYTITVTDADNIDTVAVKLKNAGLIKYPELFKLYAGITDAEEELSPGTFTLNSKYDYNALVKAMTYHSTARESVEVMIPEGYTCAQIFALLEEKGVCTVAELEEYAANGDIKDRWFLEGIQRGDKYCLEGYLFPDTYKFYTNDEPGRVLGKFLDNFDDRFTEIMKEKIDPLNERMAEVLSSRGYTQDYIDAHKFTIREIVIIASMIEKETANDTESYDISSVIYNRLTNPAEYLYLNIDATIIYALGGNIDPATGKTKPLTSEDLKLNSPYNTYTVPGLIPGPISNPGRNSLNAALDPNSTNFYYYVYNPNTSKHMFAKNAAEHEKNVAYVRSLEETE